MCRQPCWGEQSLEPFYLTSRGIGLATCSSSRNSTVSVAKHSALIASAYHLKETSTVISVGNLSLPLLFRNGGCSIQTKWRGDHSITESLSLPHIFQSSLASSSATNLASAFLLRSSAISVVGTLVPLSAST